jgi:predicted kinase
VIAVVFDVSLARCLRQNALRSERQVPEPVVRRQHEALRSALDRIRDEGFSEVRLLRDADMETG